MQAKDKDWESKLKRSNILSPKTNRSSHLLANCQAFNFEIGNSASNSRFSKVSNRPRQAAQCHTVWSRIIYFWDYSGLGVPSPRESAALQTLSKVSSGQKLIAEITKSRSARAANQVTDCVTQSVWLRERSDDRTKAIPSIQKQICLAQV